MPPKLSDETIARIMLLRACNYSYAEIEETLGITSNVVSRYLHQFNREANETTPEEAVMKNLSPLASVVIE